MKDLWTNTGTRLRLIRSNPGENLNWVFLPGGPGFDSSYFLSFTADLPIAGNIWHCDLPGNGSNELTSEYDFWAWQTALVDAVKSFPNVILVGHSFGAIFSLMCPLLEKELTGMVLLNGATKPWNQTIKLIGQELQLPSLDKHQHMYENELSDAAFKRFSLAACDYYFTPDNAAKGREIFKQTAMTYAPFDWAVNELFINFETKWLPSKIPTLFVGAGNDYITPFSIISDDKRLQRDNIEVVCIEGASHFPWIQKKQELIDCLVHFSEKLQTPYSKRIHQWTKWIAELQLISQNGLTFTKDAFDKERFEQVRTIAAEIASDYTMMTFEKIKTIFANETGYATPKLDVRAAVFDNDKILLVQERQDNLWTLPGGWADVNSSPAESVRREVKEESGFDVDVKKLIAFHDKQHQDYPPQLPHAYKALFFCDLVGGKATPSIETQAVGFFAKDEIPPLSPHRISQNHIELCFAARAGKVSRTLFD